MEERKQKVAFLTKDPPGRNIHRILPILEETEKESRHYWMATSVMAMLRYYILDRKLSNNSIGGTGPYNLLVELPNGEEFSCFCSGYNKYIDVQRLIPWGKPDPDFEEKRFATPEAAVNFLQKRRKG
jgi:hypothetical protein